MPQIRFLSLGPRGVARGGARGHAPNRHWVEFSTEKNWLCWNVGPALFSKVTLFYLSVVRSVVFCGPQISQIYGPRCWESPSFEGDDKKEKKVHPRSFRVPQCRVQATRLLGPE